MNGLKNFLSDPTPWSQSSRRWFYVAAILTLMMVGLAYLLLWFGVQGKVSAWIALLGQLVSVILTALVFWGAYRARRRDMQSKGREPRP